VTTPSSPDEPHPADTAALSGVLANRYRIERAIGAGGMATVYRARDLQHDTTVAIKLPRPELVMQLGADRFAREIQISTQLQHPHIVPVFDSGTFEGRPFYVMPFIEGETLEQRLKREGALPIEEALELTAEIADGLAYAHRNGFIHRDVKPANVLLANGHALLADFGIARAVERAGAQKLTESGFAIGTVDYMSPEQASASSEVDGRSDVYSLACVLYEMLAGQPPFAGSTARSVMARHLIDPPPPVRTVRAKVSTRLEQVLMKAMEKVPVDRYAGAAEFRAALRHPGILDDLPTGTARLPSSGRGPAMDASTVASSRRGWRAVAAAVATIAVVAAVAVWRMNAPTSLALDTNRTMVFPFVVPDGFVGARTAGEDMATIIGNALDGAGPLRWIDGWTLLDARTRDDIRSLTLEAASALARDKRCATFITGRLVTLGDSVKVFLTLHDVRGDSVLAEGAGAGGATDPWRQALLAVNTILPRLIPEGAADVSAEWANRSPGAVASFLLGEAAFRRLHLTDALGHYRNAVQGDSTFALAAIRGAQAAGWNHREGEARAMITAALARPLAPRYTSFARGYLAYLDGRPDSAIVHLTAAIAADPEMGVAWMQLGEVYTHLLPLKGNPDSLADAAFAKARQLDSTAANVLLHPIEIRLRRGDLTAAEPMLREFRRDNPDSLLVGKLAVAEACVRDGADQIDWRREASVRPLAVVLAASSLGGEGARFDCARRAYETLLAIDTAATDSADARRWVSLMGLQAVMVARGKPDSAAAVIDATMQRFGFGATLYLLGASVVPSYRERALAIAREDAAAHGATYAAVPLPTRLWELGVLEARSGRPEIADAVARELHRRAAESSSRHTDGLARSVDAFVRLARGDSAAAQGQFIALLARGATADSLQWDEADPRAAERLQLAQLLLARGAHQEAIDVASVFDSSWPLVHLLYLPASLELRATAASSLGNSVAAGQYRARLAALRGARASTGA